VAPVNRSMPVVRQPPYRRIAIKRQGSGARRDRKENLKYIPRRRVEDSNQRVVTTVEPRSGLDVDTVNAVANPVRLFTAVTVIRSSQPLVSLPTARHSGKLMGPANKGRSRMPESQPLYGVIFHIPPSSTIR
jgi:hypothetical protein